MLWYRNRAENKKSKNRKLLKRLLQSINLPKRREELERRLQEFCKKSAPGVCLAYRDGARDHESSISRIEVL